MWTILKVFTECVIVLLLFMVWVFGQEARGISAPQPGIDPTPPALEGAVLTTGPPGKSHPFIKWGKIRSVSHGLLKGGLAPAGTY